MSRKKDEPSDWETPEGGSSEAGKSFDPAAPEEPGEEPAAPAERGPVSHGTPLGRELYEKLKDDARRDRSPSDTEAQVDPSAC
jgi:hypothetical protein